MKEAGDAGIWPLFYIVAVTVFIAFEESIGHALRAVCVVFLLIAGCMSMLLIAGRGNGQQKRTSSTSLLSVGVGFLILLFAVYYLNASHEWKAGIGAVPRQYMRWLPASAAPFTVLRAGCMLLLLVVSGGMAALITRRGVNLFASAMVLTAALTSLVVLGDRLSPRPFPEFTKTGFFNYENHFAAFINLVLPFTLGMAIRSKSDAYQQGQTSSAFGIYCLGAVLMVTAVGLSGSRAGFVIACGIIGVFHFITSWRSRQKPFSWPPGFVQPVWQLRLNLSLAMCAVFALAGYVIRHGHALLKQISFRGSVLLDTWSIIKDNPVWGCGPGSFSWVFPYYQSLPPEKYFLMHAHCDPLQIVSEYGILGGFVVMALLLMVFISLPVMYRPVKWTPPFMELEGLGLMLALGGVAMHSLVDFPFRHPLIALISMIWLGMLVGSQNEVSDA